MTHGQTSDSLVMTPHNMRLMSKLSLDTPCDAPPSRTILEFPSSHFEVILETIHCGPFMRIIKA